jgi:hypothetical protein
LVSDGGTGEKVTAVQHETSCLMSGIVSDISVERVMPTEEATSGGGRGGDSDGSDDSGGASRSVDSSGGGSNENKSSCGDDRLDISQTLEFVTGTVELVVSGGVSSSRSDEFEELYVEGVQPLLLSDLHHMGACPNALSRPYFNVKFEGVIDMMVMPLRFPTSSSSF